MKKSARNREEYQGFEQGPIRPPSEATSLLIRVTRNCPWNHCSFCPVYKQSTFSLRPVEHVIRDIDTVHYFLEKIREQMKDRFTVAPDRITSLASNLKSHERMALSAALNWIRAGMRSVFLQDANSLIIKPDDLILILEHLKNRFPWIERITSYARSHTICRIRDDKLAAMRGAGLNRIHIGMESGSDRVLALVRKGASKDDHIRAGTKVKAASMELSEYVMPGLGGREFSTEHALETADALNAINPDFIRLRTLALPNHVELHHRYAKGEFSRQTDREIASEILLFLQTLKGITSTVKSDHILNLFEEIEGRFPEDKGRMIKVIEDFLALPAQEQMLFQVGRRTGILTNLSDLNDPHKRAQAENSCTRFQITTDNVDDAIDELLKRFI